MTRNLIYAEFENIHVFSYRGFYAVTYVLAKHFKNFLAKRQMLSLNFSIYFIFGGIMGSGEIQGEEFYYRQFCKGSGAIHNFVFNYSALYVIIFCMCWSTDPVRSNAII
jgi:hypothetical protein